MNYWMVTTSPENFAVTQGMGFQLQGFGQSQRRKAERMNPGDRLIYYMTRERVFPLSATITSRVFEDATPIWNSHRPGERFSHRVHLRPEVALTEGRFLLAPIIAPRLEYLRRWPPEAWPLAFQGELHLLPRRDFELLEHEMRRAAGVSSQGRHGRSAAPA